MPIQLYLYRMAPLIAMQRNVCKSILRKERPQLLAFFYGICNRQALQNIVCSYTSKCCHFFLSLYVHAHTLLIVFLVCHCFYEKIERLCTSSNMKYLYQLSKDLVVIAIGRQKRLKLKQLLRCQRAWTVVTFLLMAAYGSEHL